MLPERRLSPGPTMLDEMPSPEDSGRAECLTAVDRALGVGALWGFVDFAFTSILGSVPWSELGPIFGVPVAVSLVYHCFWAAAFEVRPLRAFEALQSAGLALPPLAFLAMALVPLSPAGTLITTSALGGCLILAWRQNGSGFGGLGFTMSLAVLYFVPAFVYAKGARRIDLDLATLASILGLFSAGLAIVGAIVLRISRRRGAWAALALIGIAAASVWAKGSDRPVVRHRDAQTPARPSALPNVLLIVMDTVRADHLDLYGHGTATFARTSRYLDQGLVFDRATAAGTFSLSSHGSLFTGMLPSAHGAHAMADAGGRFGRLFGDVPTLAGALRERGYETSGISANNVFLAEWTGLQRGFETFFTWAASDFRYRPASLVARRGLERVGLVRRRPPVPTRSAPEVTDSAIRLVEEFRPPFFLFLNYFDAHDMALLPARSAKDRPAPVGGYDRAIASIDVEVSRLLAFLEASGQLDHTLVVLTADHGQYLGERRLRGHPPVPYEPVLHVPLALRLPGTVPAGRSNRRTGLLEVFRMVTDILDGRPLDWLGREDDNPRVLSEAWNPRDEILLRSPNGGPTAIIAFAGDLKLIHRPRGRSEFFDLSVDPGEEQNLMESTEPRLVAARAALLKVIESQPRRAAPPPVSLPEEARERLRALGYLR